MTRSNIPNWQHHSKKEAKRTLKPQALRAAKKRTKTFIKTLKQNEPLRMSL
jgi:hypothetical protein